MANVKDIDIFTPNQYENIYYEAPIVARRAPTASDKYEIGKVWIDVPNNDAYFMTSITAGQAVWINAGGGSGTFTSVTATTGNITASAGDFIATLGDLNIVAGAVTFGALGAGVVQTNATGVISSSMGTNGQLLISSTAGVPTWGTITAGAGIIVTNAANAITIDATGAIASTFPTDAGIATPIAGATTVAGGTNLNTSGAGGTVTVNLDDSPSVAGSLTAGVDLNMLAGQCTVTSTANNAQSIYFHANAGTLETIDIFSDQGTGTDSINIHSDVGGLTLSSGLAAANAIIVNASDAAGGIDIDFGTGGFSVVGANGAINLESGTAAINIGADAAVHTVTVGSTTGAASTVVRSGTGNLIMASADAVTLDSVGVLELNSSAGIISIANDAVAQNVNIATGAAARTVTVGNGTGATSVVVNVGTGALNLGTNATAHTSTLGSTTGASAVTIQAGTGALAINGGGDVTVDAVGVLELNSSAGEINVGNDNISQNISIGASASARVITVGNNNTTTGLVLTAGTGNIAGTSQDAVTFDAVGVLELNSSAGIISIGNDAIAQNINLGTAGQRTITVGNGTGTTSVVVDCGTGALNLGVNATEHTSTLGSVTTASATTVQAGTGALIVNGGGDVTIDAAGVLELNSSAGIIGIGNDAVAQNINLGTGGAARDITIGNITGTTTLALNSGTGGITATSTGAGDITLASGDQVLIDGAGSVEINSSASTINLGNDAVAQAINIGTGAAARTITVGNTTAGTGIILNGGATGDIQATPATNSAASANITLNAKVGVTTHTGLSTAAAASETFVITNSEVSATSGILVSVSDVGAADAQLTIQRVKPAAGSFTVIVKNNGAATLNGDVIIAFWVLN